MRNFILFIFGVCFIPFGISERCLGQSIGSAREKGVIDYCDYCIGSQGLTPIDAGQSGLAYSIRYLTNHDVYASKTVVTNRRNSIETSITHQFSGYYHLSNIFSLAVDVPFVSRSESGLAAPVSAVLPSHKITPPHILHVGSDESYSDRNSGLSDIRILGRYKFFSNEQFSCAFTAGLKLPTGSTSAKNIEGEQLNPHLQLGTGSVDPIVGLLAYYATDQYSVTLGGLVITPTVGAEEYQFGTNLNIDATLRYAIVNLGSSTVFACFALMGETHSAEKQHSIEVPNTGGTTLFLSPGVRWLVNSSMAIEARFDYPFYHDLQGSQLGESYRFSGGIQYSF